MRLSALHADAAAAAAAPPPTIVRSEGTSVLVRELEKVHLRNKVGSRAWHAGAGRLGVMCRGWAVGGACRPVAGQLGVS